ncbi:MAG: hypothetical protein K1X83_06150 [Oligoflexia bacterium]|nr:hypothetical protein [Oligoflexia bacterium]
MANNKHQEQNRRHFSWLRAACWIALLVVGGACLALPLSGRFEQSWSSGPISKHHGMLAGDCQSCHSAPFVRVKDESCLACHSLSKHSDAALKIRCADCHLEHNGDHGLIQSDARPCTACHASQEVISPEADLKSVTNLATHPEFNLPLADKSHIKLNHSKHLKAGLQGSDGPVTLGCGDCHGLSADFKSMEPVNFDKHCRSCHSLEFDERLPGNQAPHASPDLVFNYLYAEYAKFFLADDNGRQKERAFPRFRPGEVPEPEARTEYVRKYVAAEARVAEKLLFSRTGCFLCHDVSNKPTRDSEVSTGELSNFKVEKTSIPNLWLPASIFNHGAHEEISCESCHAKARDSETTTDVLLPQVGLCRDCHADQGAAHKLASPCVTCHSFHDSLPLEQRMKREIAQILERGK